jgi:hypothetical protein
LVAGACEITINQARENPGQFACAPSPAVFFLDLAPDDLPVNVTGTR